MRRTVLILASLFLLIAVPVAFFATIRARPAEAGWMDTNWGFRERIPVTNTSGSDQSNWQTLITFDTATPITAGKMLSTCNDIRFTSVSGKALPYWIEPNTCNTTTTKIWVKVDSIPNGGGNIYIYYGNPSAASANYKTSDVFIRDLQGTTAAWPLQETTATQSDAAAFNPTTTGRNIIIDGTFTSDPGPWTKQTGWTINTSTNTAHHDGTAGTFYLYQSSVIVPGKKYQVTYTVSNISAGNVIFYLGIAVPGTTRTTNGTFTETLTAQSDTSLYLQASSGFLGDISNVSVVQLNVPSSAAPTQLLTDGNMEASGTAAWTAVQSATLSKQTTNPHGGSQVLRVAVGSAGQNPFASQTILAVGQVYRAYGFMRSDGNTGNTPVVRNPGVNIVVGTNSTTWQPFDIVFVATNQGLLFGASSTTLGQYVEFDDVTISLDNATRPDQILSTLDGDMEQSGTSYWTANNGATLSKQTTSPHGGTQVLRVTGANLTYASQNILVKGKTYRVTGFARGDGVAASPRMAMAGSTTLYTGTTSNSWQQIDVTFVATGTDLDWWLSTASSGYVEFDDCTLQEVSPLVGNNGNNAANVTVGASSGASGHLANAYSFNGNQFVNIYSSDLNSAFNPNEGTLVAWAKVASSGVWSDSTTRGIVYIKSDSNNNIYIQKSSASNKVDVGYVAGGTTNQISNTSISTTGWFQVVITWSSSANQAKVFFNGAQQGATLTNIGTWVGNLNSTVSVIGALSSSGASPWSGLINDVHLYNRALSAQEISDLYGNGTIDRQSYYTDNYPGHELIRQYATTVGVGSVAAEEVGAGPIAYWSFDEGSGLSAYDKSSNNNTGTLSGTTKPTWQTEDQCVSGKCLYFNSSTAYVGTNLSASSSKLTMSAWSKLTKSDPGTFYAGFILNKDDNSPKRGPALFYQWNGGVLQLNCYISIDGSTGTQNLYSFSAAQAATIVNTWHQTSCTYDGVSIKTYLDGQLLKTSNLSGSIFATSTTWSVGNREPLNDAPFQGFIDEPKIYSYARSAAQIQSDYLAGATRAGSSSIVGAQKPFLSNGLVGYWKMDEASWNGTSGEVKDASGNGNNGTSINGATTTAGKFGNGGLFNSTGYVTTSSLTGSATAAASYSVWVKPQFGINNWTNNAVAFWQNGGNLLLYSTGGPPAVRITDTNSNTISVNLAATTDGVWSHYVIVVPSGINQKALVYVNGQLNTTLTPTVGYGWNGGAVNATQIGDSSGRFRGTVDELRVYNRALSADEVRQLYNYAPGPVGWWKFDERTGNTANDSSGNGNTGLVNCTGVGCVVPTWITGKYGSSLSFANSSAQYGGYVRAPLINLPSVSGATITISMWAKPSATQTIGQANLVRNAVNSENYGLFINGSNKLQLELYDGSAYRTCTSNAGLFTAGQWNYLTAVFVQGTSVSFYVNGQFQQTVSCPYTSTQPSSDYLYIGGNAGGYQGYVGAIDDVRIYNYARTSQQIQEDMRGTGNLTTGEDSSVGGSASSTQPAVPIGYWKFDEGFGTTANNYGNGGSTLNGTLTNMASPATSTSGWQIPQSGACKANGCLGFNGGFVALPLVSTQTQNISMSFWVYPTSSQYTPLFWNGNAGLNGYGIYIGNGSHAAGNDIEIYLGGITYNALSTHNAVVPNNQWTHVVITRDTSTWNVYVNGVQTDSSTVSPNTPTGTAAIGRRTDTAPTFGGFLDEVKFFGFALTPDQIRQEYNQGLALNAGVGKLDSANFSDGTGNPPVAYWNFEEGSGSTVNDRSGNGNTGTWNGTLGNQWTQGKYGKGGNFNGTDNYVNAGNASSLNFERTNPFSISAWIKTAQLSGNPAIITKTLSTSALPGWWVQLVNGNIEVYLNSNYATNNYIRVLSSGTTVADGKWHYVDVIYTGTSTAAGISIYIDGALQAKTVTSDALSASMQSSGVVDIGTYANGSGHQFSGVIDEVKIYNYARTPAQIAYDYNRGAPIGWWKMDECQGTTIKDFSGNGNNGTLTVGASGTQTAAGTCNTAGTAWGNGATGKFNSSLNFDGSDDYVDLGNPTYAGGGSQMTWSIWVNPSSISGGLTCILCKFNNTNTQTAWNIQKSTSGLGGSDALLVALSSNSSDGNTYAYTGPGKLVVGKWTHVVMVFDGTQSSNSTRLKVYVNGALQSLTFAGTVQSSIVTGTTSNIRLGSTSDGARWFSGQIDDVRIYNYALSPTQVKLLYNGGFSLFYGPLVGSP